MWACVSVEFDNHPCLVENLLVDNPAAGLCPGRYVGVMGEAGSLFQALSVPVDQGLVPHLV